MPIRRPTTRADGLRRSSRGAHWFVDEGLLDLGFGFCAAVAMLFSPTFAKAGPALMSLILAAYAALRAQDWIVGLRRSWLILALPAAALASAFWSLDRVATLYYGTQYLITVLLAIAIGTARRPQKLFLGLFGGFALYSAVNLVLGRSVGWEGRAGAAFGGLAGVKNYMGATSALGALSSTVFLLRWVRAGRWLAAFVALVALAMQLVSIKIALAAGAGLGYVEGAAVVAVLVFARYFIPLQARYAFAAAAASVGAVALCFHQQLTDLATRFAVTVLHKDMTLTGRTYLWARGEQLIQARPGLGAGFAAFWRQGNLDAEGLWRSEDIASRSGFNFHSTPIGWMVELGVLGLCVLAVVLAVCGGRLIIRTLREPDDVSVFWTAILVYQIASMGYEAIGLGPFNYDTILLVAALAYGGGAGPLRVRAQARSADPRTAQVMEGASV